ncbi:MAG TPA: hypothetical protein VK988_18375 [Acidimicrobiales bacterium]|nr:hypothetical protein [Acidimicrobiales bacterium]
MPISRRPSTAGRHHDGNGPAFPINRYGHPGPTGCHLLAGAGCRGQPEAPLLEEWRQQLGDEAIAGLVEDVGRKITNGSLRGFSDKGPSDKGESLDHLRGPRRRSA